MMGLEWSSMQVYVKLLLCSLLVISCRQKKDYSETGITILWDNDRAVGLAVPFDRTDTLSIDSPKNNLQVNLVHPEGSSSMAGDFSFQNRQIIFRPLIPFTRGLHYAVLLNHQVLADVMIPRDTILPKLMGIYPVQDTVPENLLKIYLIFSKPMVQGHALQYIKLTSEQGDSLPDSFLYLPSELWNEEGNQLTLWLDPGRIKRGLIPNKQMGSPLIKGRHYKLVISDKWQDVYGTSLGHLYSKDYFAANRDSVLPIPGKWETKIPEKNTVAPLEINFGEPLDYALLKHAIQVTDTKNALLHGDVTISDDQKKILFTPTKPWSAGSYKILVEGRLEDLAGNNLNRLFDVDLQSGTKSKPSRNIFERQWQIN